MEFLWFISNFTQFNYFDYLKETLQKYSLGHRYMHDFEYWKIGFQYLNNLQWNKIYRLRFRINLREFFIKLFLIHFKPKKSPKDLSKFASSFRELFTELIVSKILKLFKFASFESKEAWHIRKRVFIIIEPKLVHIVQAVNWIYEFQYII